MKAVKVLLTFACLYTIFAEIFVTIVYLSNRIFDIAIHLTNFIIICTAFLLPFLVFDKIKISKYKTAFIIPISMAFFSQIFIGFLDYLSRTPDVNKSRLLWMFDIPNILSALILLISGTIILKTTVKI